MIVTRPLQEDDLPFGGRLVRQAGWNQTEQDWRNLLTAEGATCRLALLDGSPVGTVSLLSYSRSLAWIGMLLVEENQRGRGVGKGLLEAALHEAGLQGVGCVGLDATPAGRPLYCKRGFVETAEIFRWEGAPTGLDDGGLPPITAKDWPELEGFDASLFGVSRLALLQRLAPMGRTVICRMNGEIRGYGMSRPGQRATYLGPVMATDSTAAARVARTLLVGREQALVYWDCPAAAEDALISPLSLGFVRQRPLHRMMFGPPVKQEMARLLALADPATG